MSAKREKSTHTGIDDKMLTKVLAGINDEEEVGPMGCHLWERATNAWGFGVARDGKRVISVTRYLAERFLPLPDMKNLVVGHVCGNRLCCRLGHLVWLSPSANGLMASDQGKFAGPRQKLTDEQVIIARRLLATGETKCVDLAVSFGVTPSAVNQAARGSTFKHLNDDYLPFLGGLFMGNGGRGHRRPDNYERPSCRAFMKHLGLTVDEGDSG